MYIKIIENKQDFEYNKNLLEKIRNDEGLEKDFLMKNITKIHKFVAVISERFADLYVNIDNYDFDQIEELFSENSESFYNPIYLNAFMDTIDEFISIASKNIDFLKEHIESMSYKSIMSLQNVFQHNKKITHEFLDSVKGLF